MIYNNNITRGRAVRIARRAHNPKVVGSNPTLASYFKKRMPIIAVMGQVNNGKTSLIDYLLKSNIKKKEKGNITQHLKHYLMTIKEKKINIIRYSRSRSVFNH